MSIIMEAELCSSPLARASVFVPFNSFSNLKIRRFYFQDSRENFHNLWK